MTENLRSHNAISDLVHRYANAVNDRDSEAWSSTFALEASWDLGPERAVKGRAEILSLWTKEMQRFRKVVQIVDSGTVDLDRSGRSGSGRWYFKEHFERNDGTSGFMVAHYDDEYLKVNGQWLFAVRSLVLHDRQTSGAEDGTGSTPIVDPLGPEVSTATGQNDR